MTEKRSERRGTFHPHYFLFVHMVILYLNLMFVESCHHTTLKCTVLHHITLHCTILPHAISSILIISTSLTLHHTKYFYPTHTPSTLPLAAPSSDSMQGHNQHQSQNQNQNNSQNNSQSQQSHGQGQINIQPPPPLGRSGGTDCTVLYVHIIYAI